MSISSTNASRIPNTPYQNYQSNNTENYFYFLNAHNDVAYFSNSTFDDFESYEYNPWGVLLTQANKNNLLYTSREFDFETGLQFSRMRYYLPNLGRFSQKNLIYNNNANYYFYVQNNPENALDPFGLYNVGGMIPWMLPGPTFDGQDGAAGTCDDPGELDDCLDYCTTYEKCTKCCTKLYDRCIKKCQWWNIWCQADCAGWKSRCENDCLQYF